MFQYCQGENVAAISGYGEVSLGQERIGMLEFEWPQYVPMFSVVEKW
jgi:hypothetical protein